MGTPTDYLTSEAGAWTENVAQLEAYGWVAHCDQDAAVAASLGVHGLIENVRDIEDLPHPIGLGGGNTERIPILSSKANRCDPNA